MEIDQHNEPNSMTPNTNKTVTALRGTPGGKYRDSPFVVPPSPLMKKLGCGTYVTIYKYKRSDKKGRSPWAIKKANGNARQSIIKRLTTEGEILRSLNHPNIVTFKKLSHTAKGEICLSMEAFGRGLDDIISDYREEDLVFRARYIMKVAWSVAKALQYLHNDKRLLHGDIKSGNILVHGRFEQIKLCDFGVSIFLNETLTGARDANASYIGSEPWHPREIIDEQIITDKADIFAYGLVIWEMLARDVPHIALMTADESDLDGSYIDTGTSDVIEEAYFNALGTRPPLPDIDYSADYNPLIETFICCTLEDYKQRPNANNIIESLKTQIAGYEIAED